MSSPTQPTAAHRVFATAELVESILLEIPDNTTLLRSQTVSRLFAACIKKCPEIQQRLFLQPVSDPNTLTHFITAANFGGDETTEFNPLAFTRPRPNTAFTIHRQPFQNGYRMLFRLPGFKNSILVQNFSKPRVYSFRFFAKELSSLQTSHASSFLDMFLQNPLPTSINILAASNRLYPKPGSLAGWRSAEVDIKPGRLRDIIAVAMALRNAAEEKTERMDEEAKERYRCDGYGDEEDQEEEPQDEFVWESHFSYELRGILLTRPEIAAWVLSRRLVRMIRHRQGSA